MLVLPQINGYGGIPRFNRNLISALPNAEKISLNDKDPIGYNKNKWLFLLSFMRHLFCSKKSYVIIGHLNFVPLSFVVKVLSNKKTITVLHGVEAWQKRKSIKPFLRFSDEYWAVSNYTANRFSKTYGIDICRVKSIFNTLPRDWSIKSNECNPFFLSVTRLDQSELYKGIDKTLEAIAQLKEIVKLKKFKYTIVAHGDDVNRHVKMVSDLEITDLVEFKINLTDVELQILYETCSFFVLPSSGEGFGIVYLEAMACGKPCIGASDCGAEDVINHNVTGFLVEPTPSGIKPYIEKLLNEPELAESMGKAGLDRLQEKFVFDKFKLRIDQLLET